MAEKGILIKHMAQSQDSNSLLATSNLPDMSKAIIAIVHTEWNDAIIAEQIKGAMKVLNHHNTTVETVLPVPGSFELPYACRQVYEQSKGAYNAPDAIIAFGAVIRGGTPHFEYVSQAVTDGIVQLNVSLPVPVIFGVLTLDNEEQAWERLGGAHGHKGEEAAITALKMIAFNRKLKNI